MNIDLIAENIVTSFNKDDAISLKENTKNMLRQINNNESMFSIVKNPYTVAKSLFFMLTEDYLTQKEQMSAVKLAYFCLLINYLNNKDKKPGDPKYEDLVSGSKLALVLITMQSQFLMYSIIAGQGNYINPETHIRNQIQIFGGIAKEAKMAKCDYTVENIIDTYYVDIFNELYNNFPVGRNLDSLKENCYSVIKNIKTMINVNLKDDNLWDLF